MCCYPTSLSILCCCREARALLVHISLPAQLCTHLLPGLFLSLMSTQSGLIQPGVLKVKDRTALSFTVTLGQGVWVSVPINVLLMCVCVGGGFPVAQFRIQSLLLEVSSQLSQRILCDTEPSSSHSSVFPPPAWFPISPEGP